MRDIENNFPEHYKPKGEPTKIEHEIDDRYYEHDCSRCMKNSSSNNAVNKNIAQETNMNSDQKVIAKRHNYFNDRNLQSKMRKY